MRLSHETKRCAGADVGAGRVTGRERLRPVVGPTVGLDRVHAHGKYIRRGTHRSIQQLEQAIREYLGINNANPKPFSWTKSADDILASIERFCLRISSSEH
jgi:hypothetical protein